jgi:23S rRNA maturation-related 3'-5' exoribonuclease YhaM
MAKQGNAKATGGTHPLIMHQEVGDNFSGTYYVEQVSEKLTVHGKPYTDMMLRDKSGSRPVKFWGSQPQDVEKGVFLFAACVVEEYLGAPSVISRNIEKTDRPDDLDDYIAVYVDADAFADRFDQIRDEIEELEEDGDETCSRLVKAVYNGSFFIKFGNAPGSTKPHYGCVSGLLASIVRVADACTRMADLYNLTNPEKALMYAAALLHRVGGVDAYEFNDCMPAETTRGVLVGVKNLTFMRVYSAVRRIMATDKKGNAPPVSQDIVMRLMHAVASHDSVGVEPMTKEALVLNAAWRADSEVVEAVDFIANDLNEQDDFTAFDPARGRRYYRGA